MKFFKEILLIIVIVIAVFLAKKWYQTPSHSAGTPAPEFTAKLINGDSIKLSQFKGSYVLLEFWGSWCGPCRANNRQLTQLHQKFSTAKFESAKGFEMISIGIETDRDQWERAILKDKLFWPYHVSDIQRFGDHVAALYGIREIPASILINPEGLIIGVNLPNAQLVEILTRKLKKS